MALPTAPTSPSQPSPYHRKALESLLLHNLKHGHQWTALSSHTSLQTQPQSQSQSDSQPTSSAEPFRLPLLSGLPPKRIYIHPDDQTRYLQRISVLKAELRAARQGQRVPSGTNDINLANSTDATDKANPANGAEEPDLSTLTINAERSTISASIPNPIAADPIAAKTTRLERDIEAQIHALTKAYEAPRREFVAAIWQNMYDGLSLAQIARVFDDIDIVVSSSPASRTASTSTPHADRTNDSHGSSGASIEDLNGARIDEPGSRKDGKNEGQREMVRRFLLAIVDSDSSIVFYVVSDGVVKARQN